MVTFWRRQPGSATLTAKTKINFAPRNGYRERLMKFWGLIFALLAFTGFGAAQSLNCNLQDYKSIDGIKVVASADSVELPWEGEAGAQLRAAFTLRDGQPVVKELAARKGDGEWIVLGKDLTPQFEVTTGRRRIASVELNNLKHYNLDTPE